MVAPRLSPRPLQVAVAICGLVPVGAGLSGVLLGPRMTGAAVAAIQGGASLDSHYRYLSGLLLGIGLAFWSLIPGIATRGASFRLLTALVVVGGLGRLLGVALQGVPPASMLFGLGMELVVTPLLCLWQARVAARTLQ
ncbi:MAG: DUF4345 domain-containing protein [Acidisphaera sp.]|nr:DUF4345 domain-containing protein [Acidisphaera sp.]MBV9811995.1 DUF4345 domain-containing protein [Acetobacteraceae bacterium]